MVATPKTDGSHPPVPFSSRRKRGWIDRAPGPPWRSRDDRMVTGVAGGVAEWLGVSPLAARVVLAFLTVGSGIGPVLYVLAAVLLPVSDRSVAPADRPIAMPKGRDRDRALLAVLVSIGVSILLRAVGVWIGGDLGAPAAIAAAGISLVSARSDGERREAWRARLVRLPGDPEPVETGAVVARRRRATVLRTIAGAGLFIIGASWVLSVARPSTVVPILGAIAATVGGIALLGGPWISALWRDLTEERRARIRTEERAEVAAQLHDSVLQTLALIQRHPETPAEVAQIARQQERSLRSWLFDETPMADAEASAGSALPFADQLRRTVHEVEDRFGVPIELVVVGDAVAMDERRVALVAAAREAVVNAATHSGAPSVSVYAESGTWSTSVFVRDRGKGFDLDSVPPDRRGVRDSIVSRIQRHDGTATVTSSAGEGTEVALEVPR
jgi:signal transduction histidine kinase/phage shock protein PspC (stress-responsive transcriptional regulator)